MPDFTYKLRFTREPHVAEKGLPTPRANTQHTRTIGARSLWYCCAEYWEYIYINENDAMAKGSVLRTQLPRATLLLRRLTAGSGQAHLLRDSNPQSLD